MNRAGKVLLDKALPNEETKLGALIGKLKQRGQILFVAAQPAAIGALSIVVAQSEDVLVDDCPVWSIGEPLTCTRARRRPIPAAQRSSPKLGERSRALRSVRLPSGSGALDASRVRG